MSGMDQRVSRGDLFRIGAIGAASFALAACAPSMAEKMLTQAVIGRTIGKGQERRSRSLESEINWKVKGQPSMVIRFGSLDAFILASQTQILNGRLLDDPEVANPGEISSLVGPGDETINITRRDELGGGRGRLDFDFKTIGGEVGVFTLCQGTDGNAVTYVWHQVEEQQSDGTSRVVSKAFQADLLMDWLNGKQWQNPSILAKIYDTQMMQLGFGATQ
jgi:hypothetical protein